MNWASLVRWALAAVAFGTLATAAAAVPVAEAATPVSPAARQVADWVVSRHDNGLLPFMIVDKVAARLVLFDADGQVEAVTPVLLGRARGDDSVAGIGARPLARIAPAEQITPAGRFVAEAGKNLAGRDILWLDYDSGIALHRASDVKPGATVRDRLDRLARATPGDSRVSLGCVNVSTAFYDSFVRPFAATGIVYILPETRSAEAQFHMHAPQIAVAAPSPRG